jgi:hypothetical protein
MEKDEGKDIKAHEAATTMPEHQKTPESKIQQLYTPSNSQVLPFYCTSGPEPPLQTIHPAFLQQ